MAYDDRKVPTKRATSRHAVYVFEERHRSYRCCCHLCHVKLGAILIGMIELLYCLYEVGVNAYVLFTVDREFSSVHALFLARICFHLLAIVAILLMLVSISKTQPLLVIPHLILQLLWILFLSTMIILAILAIIFREEQTIKNILDEAGRVSAHCQIKDPRNSNKETATVTDQYGEIVYEKPILGECSYFDGSKFIIAISAVTIIIAILFLLIQLWWFFVVKKLYHYLKDKRAWANRQTASQQA